MHSSRPQRRGKVNYHRFPYGAREKPILLSRVVFHNTTIRNCTALSLSHCLTIKNYSLLLKTLLLNMRYNVVRRYELSPNYPVLVQQKQRAHVFSWPCNDRVTIDPISQCRISRIDGSAAIGGKEREE